MFGGRSSANSPYDEGDLDTLIDMSQKKIPIKQIYINKYYELKLYEEINVRHKIIMGVDVASGIGKDSSAIVLVDSETKHIVGILHNNKIDTDDLSEIIYTLATTIVQNCMICIERNNVGASVISKLRKLPEIEPKLYKQLTVDDLKEKRKNGYIVEKDVNAASYGIYTDATKRFEMHEVLSRFVRDYKERICAFDFVEEIKTLEYKKNGRIEHADGKHDDIVMAYLMAIWAYYYGNNISAYGILRKPDPSPGMTEIEEAQMRYQEELKKSKQSVLLNSLYSDSNQTRIMTMKDFLEEQEILRNRYTDNNTIIENPNGDGVVGMSDRTIHLDIFNDSFGGDDSYGDIDFNNFV